MTKQILVMNNFPLVEMLAFFPRYSEVYTFDWRPRYVRQVRHIRSCHTKTLGGVQYSFFSIVTQQGEAMDVRFNHDELLWDIVALPGSELAIHSEDGSHFVIDRILVHQQRHKHQPSMAHRIRPIRFEWLPYARCARKSPIEENPHDHTPLLLKNQRKFAELFLFYKMQYPAFPIRSFFPLIPLNTG